MSKEENKELREYYAKEFKATRKGLHLSQAKMSEILRISPRSYCDLENAVSLCSTTVLNAYVTQFDIDRNALFDGSKEPLEKFFERVDK